jgi:hypothetical protein
MARGFYTTYRDEAWSVESEEELRNGKNVRGLDHARLEAACSSRPPLRQESTPPSDSIAPIQESRPTLRPFTTQDVNRP